MADVKNYIIGTILTLGSAVLYEKYIRHDKQLQSVDHQNLIQQFLLNSDSLEDTKKPILWIHVAHEKNARWWQSFYSRNTEYLNQPYIFLTIRSIIQHCANSFQIALMPSCEIIMFQRKSVIINHKASSKHASRRLIWALFFFLLKYAVRITPAPNNEMTTSVEKCELGLSCNARLGINTSVAECLPLTITSLLQSQFPREDDSAACVAFSEEVPFSDTSISSAKR